MNAEKRLSLLIEKLEEQVREFQTFANDSQLRINDNDLLDYHRGRALGYRYAAFGVQNVIDLYGGKKAPQMASQTTQEESAS